MMKTLFISYRRGENRWAVSRLRERLSGEFGKRRVFSDDRITGGEEWSPRLEKELASASAVVMVYGEEWAGRGAGVGGRSRVFDERDWVRKELRTAHENGVAVIPVKIDGTDPPSAEDLPDDLKFLAALQFIQIGHEDSLDDLVADIRRVLQGGIPFAHYLMQAAWVAAVAVSLVWLAQGAGLLNLVDDAVGRTVQYLRAQRGPILPPGYAVVEVDNNEFRELFGGRTPLDPEVMTIFVSALRDASRAQCRAGGSSPAPVGFNVDLSPGESGANDERFERLAHALRELAACRPVVLACPQSVETREPPASDLRWLGVLASAPSPGERPVTLASTTVDSSLLRHTEWRTELGIVVGDLAAGRAPFGNSPAAADCACAWRRDAVGACNAITGSSGSALDSRALVVPFRAQRLSFAESLLHVGDLGEEQVVIIGGGFGTQSRFAVRALPDFQRDGATGAMVNAFLARSANEEPFTASRYVQAGIDLAVAMVTSIGLMLLWHGIAARSHRYALRALDYAGVIGLFVGIPIVCIGVSVWDPRLLPWAASASVVSVATCLRSAMSGYEMLLNHGIDWQSLPNLVKAIHDEPEDRVSAAIRAGVAGLEALLIVAGVAVIVSG